jgi:DMSO/TMAO reductase YedYZ heme-binding membrane subunit
MNLRSIRIVVAYFSAIIAGICCLLIFIFVPSPQIRIIRLDQVFAFLSIIFLYLALLISPLYHSFKTLPYEKKVIESRRTIGVASFIFALLHTVFAFFGQLNGFAGLSFLDNNFLFSFALGFVGLEILMILALTSFDKAVSYLTFQRWKFLHRFVYIAGILILIHMLLLGSHYQVLSSLIPIATFVCLAFLFILEAVRFDYYLEKSKKFTPRFGISLIAITVILSLYGFYTFLPSDKLSFGIHTQHLLLAEKNQTSQLVSNPQGIPGLTGDPNLRYTVSFSHDPNLTPGEPTTLHFTVYNASTGEEVKLFSRVYEKVMHLIIVDESLTYFNHIHPIQAENDFTVTTVFPKKGRYHLYIDFQPLGGIEQQMAFTLTIGNPDLIKKKTTQPDTKTSKTINDYQVTFHYPTPLTAKKLSIGQEQLSFTITDAQSHKAVTTLKPYLAAFGHLTMINESSFDFVHVHPFPFTSPAPNSNGGPTVTFVPLGLWGPIKPGTYRIFAEFNPNNKLINANFTVRVE